MGSFALAAVAVLFFVLCIDQARLIFGYAQHWANEDHTLLWYAARDLGHGHLEQPTFYGEAYFTVLDSAPAEFLRRFGMSIATATSFAAALLSVAGWPLLALAAWRRGHRVLASAALAFPLVVSFEFLVSAEKPSGGGDGVFCAMLAVAALVVCPTRTTNGVAFAAFGTLGAVWNYSTVYLLVPAAAFVIGMNWRATRTLVAGLLACPACAHARRLAIVQSCTFDRVTPTLAIMRTAPAPAIEVWRRLGEPVRPFDAPTLYPAN